VVRQDGRDQQASTGPPLIGDGEASKVLAELMTRAPASTGPPLIGDGERAPG